MTRADLSPLAWLDEVEQQRRAAGLRRSLRTRRPVGAELDLASNDYLGLSQHPDVIDGGVEALRTWGAGSTGSRLVTGNTELHEGFETALADFVGAESALVFSSGYTANLGAVVSLAGAGIAVGVRRADARVAGGRLPAVARPRRRDTAPRRRAVEAALAGRDEERAVVVTDSVFSADGVLAPLRALHDVCRRHGALLIVDEAHGLGVRGSGGRGLLHEVGLAGAPDVVMTTTLSKALGSQGGVVLGPARGACPPDRRRAAVHLRHRAGPRRCRRRAGRAAGADRRAVARAGRARPRGGARPDVRTSPNGPSRRWCRSSSVRPRWRWPPRWHAWIGACGSAASVRRPSPPARRGCG